MSERFSERRVNNIDLMRVLDLVRSELGGHEERFQAVLERHMECEEKYFEGFSDKIKEMRVTLYGDESEGNPGIKTKVDRIETGIKMTRWLAGSGLGLGLLALIEKISGIKPFK